MSSSSGCASASPRSPWAIPLTNHDLGPVINQAALNSMLGYIETGKKEGRLIAGGNAPATSDGGYFLEPTIFAEIAPNAVIAQEEIFGPVLALIKVASFDEGLRVANNTEYGLTGSLYTNDPRKSCRAAAPSMWAISTSIASAPAPWSARIPLADST